MTDSQSAPERVRRRSTEGHYAAATTTTPTTRSCGLLGHATPPCLWHGLRRVCLGGLPHAEALLDDGGALAQYVRA